MRRARSAAGLAAGCLVGTAAGIIVLDQLLRRAGRSDLVALDAAGAAALMADSAIACMGLIVVWRTQHVVGWWLLGIAVAGMTAGLAEAYASYGEIAAPGSLPASAAIAPLSEAAFWPVFACLAMILLLTPTGQPSTPRWRRLVPVILGAASAWVAISMLSDDPFDPPLDQLDNPLGIAALQPLLTVGEPIAALVTHVAVIAAGISLVRRFRRSTGVERQQLRWVAFAAMVTAVAVIAAFTAAVNDWQLLLGVAALIVFTAIPVGVTIAVSRYRLYGLDRVISRSVLFSVLTVLVAVVYAVVVLALGGLLGRGQLTSAVAAIAAARCGATAQWCSAHRGPTALRTTIRSLRRGQWPQPATPSVGVARQGARHARRDRGRQAATAVRRGRVGDRLGACHSRWMSSPGCERFPLTYQGEDVGTLVLGLRRGEDAFEHGERSLLVDLARHAGAVVRSAAVMSDLHPPEFRLVSAGRRSAAGSGETSTTASVHSSAPSRSRSTPHATFC